MTRRTKTLIAVFGTLFVTCICCGGFGLWGGYFIQRTLSVEMTPAEIAAIGAEIADYTVPPDFSEAFGMELLGTRMVAISSDITVPDNMLIMLMSVPNAEEIDQEILEQQLSAAMQQQFAFQRLDLTLDTVETRTINDREATFTFRQGESSNGIPYRQMSGLFDSSKGKAFLLVQGAEAKWDQAALDSFLDSIR